MKRLYILLIALCLTVGLAAQNKNVTITILETSDVHGAFFPYDFINSKPLDGSLARVSSIVRKQREEGKNPILLDNGDILQGQPTVYYYNFIDTTTRHLYLRIVDFMKYDAAGVGNHDIETGHAVYDRMVKQNRVPMLAANAVRTDNGKPYFKPYTIIERNGVKVAVIGLITPAIPKWLPQSIWAGMRFDDMVESASKWVNYVKEKEHPHVIIGLFHAGHDYTYEGENENTPRNENASLLVAKKIPGFDAVLIGHDHERYTTTVVNTAGDTVVVLDPASGGRYVGEVSVKVQLKNGKLKSKRVSGRLIDANNSPIDSLFMQTFADDYKKVEQFVTRQVGMLTKSISSRPAYFGPSEFTDLIHRIQLDITGADISFTAPLSYDTEIKAGNVYVSDMFKLYRYENLLYTMKLTGEEITKYLEFSYNLWVKQMTGENDHLLLLREDEGGKSAKLQNAYYNLDGAAGIIYTVDASKPFGQRVNITSMYDGSPFQVGKTYKVAINSYRGNGGGGHLTQGAGIPASELSKRIVASTDKDLRYYLMQWIIQQQTVTPSFILNSNEWKFAPEEWTKPAAQRDYKLLFGSKQVLEQR